MGEKKQQKYMYAYLEANFSTTVDDCPPLVAIIVVTSDQLISHPVIVLFGIVYHKTGLKENHLRLWLNLETLHQYIYSLQQFICDM